MDQQLDNARSYVALVKQTLGAGTAQYQNFLTILKGYRTGEIAVYDVIDQISGLFRGDSEYWASTHFFRKITKLNSLLMMSRGVQMQKMMSYYCRARRRLGYQPV